MSEPPEDILGCHLPQRRAHGLIEPGPRPCFGSTEILLELRQIAAAIGIAFLSIASIRRGLIKAERLIVVIIYGTFAISFVKAALVAASFISNVDPISVTRVLFGDNVRAEPIILGLVRLDFSAYIVGAFALFALLAPSVSGVHFGRASKVIISLVVLLGSGFLTYARAIWLVYVVCVVAAMVVERNWKAMVLTVCATVTFVAVSYGVLSTIFEERFITEAELSDEGRVDQAKHLIEEIKVRPVLGKGMGAHFDSDSRGDKQRYSYELQWLAFLMQFGILGVMGIVVLIAASAHDLVKARHPARPWVLLIFALWLLESCLNPHMTSSYAGATFGLFMAMFYRMRNAKNDGMNETMAVFPVTATH